MSAASIDAAMALAIEALFGAGTYRQQSDTRQDRERVDPTNVAYQLVVFETAEDPSVGANRSRRLYTIRTRVKKHVATQPAERVWRLGAMADGLESLLARQFYTGLGLDLYVDNTEPETTDDPETVGNVTIFQVEATDIGLPYIVP